MSEHLTVAPISIINDDTFESSKILLLRAINDPIGYPGSIVKSAVSTTTTNPINKIQITRDTHLSFEGVGDIQVAGNDYERLVSICLRVWFTNGASIRYIFQHTSDHPTQWTSGYNTFNYIYLGELSYHTRNLWDDYIFSTGQQPPGNLRIDSILPTVYGSMYGVESWAKWNDIDLSEKKETPEVNSPPVASFIFSPEIPLYGEMVTFDASSSYDSDGQIVNRKWNFGDGNIIDGTGLITHTYNESGDYTVKLTVTDDKGETDSIEKTIKVRELIIRAWTDGHFIEEVQGWTSEDATVPLHIVVKDSTNVPIKSATIYIDDQIYGYTNDNGYLEIRYPVLKPPSESLSVVAKAIWNNSTVESEPIILYDSEHLVHKKIGPITELQATLFNLLYAQDMQSAPKEPEWLTFIRWILWKWASHESLTKGDVITLNAYGINASNVQPLWLVRVTREYSDGQIYTWDNWTENYTVFSELINENNLSFTWDKNLIHATLASPAVLYVTAPDGSHAGYNPTTGEIEMDFPIAISKPGQEPFHLFIPNANVGEYLVEVIGTGEGSYTLSFNIYNPPDIESEIAEFTNNIKIGEIHESLLKISENGEVNIFLTVKIDIRPSSKINPFKDNAHGAIPIAIYGSNEYNVRNISIDSLRLENLAVKSVGLKRKLMYQYKDINNDSLEDLFVIMDKDQNIFDNFNSHATLTGNLIDGRIITGSDIIRLF